MGVSFSFAENIICFVLEGDNTVEQAKKAFSRAFSEMKADRSMILVDARSSQRNRDLAEVVGFAENLLFFKERMAGKCALVINEQRQNPIGLERRLAAFSLREKIQFGLFLDLESAENWLKET